MKKILFGVVLSIFFFTSLIAQTKRVSTSPPLVHTGNGSSGVSFNLTAGSAPIVVKDIGGISYTGTYTMDIHYKTSAINNPSPGWAVNSSNGWIKAGTYTFTGIGTTTRVSYTGSQMNLVIPSNTTYGIAITSTSYPYNTYNSSNPKTFTNNGEATINIGPGIGYGGSATSMSNHPRSFIGYVDYEIQGFNADAGISDMPYPGIPVCATLTDSISLEVTNYGFKTLDSCVVNWMVNDSIQPSIKYKNTLLPNISGRTSLKYYKSLAYGDTVKAWTTMPNGVPDSLPKNDTLYIIARQGLSGTYQVGGASADYAKIDSAIIDLNLRGVCSAVTFILNDSNNSASVSINKFDGSSSTNLVTFTSKTGVRASCFITSSSTSSSSNYALIFSGATHVKMKDISITNSSSGTFAGVVDLVDNPKNISFENCDIKSNHAGSSQTAYLINSKKEDIAESITIRNCKLEGGSWAIHVEGAKNSNMSDWTIEKCEFLNNTRSAIWMKYVNGVTISSNVMESNSSNTGVAAVLLDETTGYIEIYGNYIKRNRIWPTLAIQVKNSIGASNKRNLISTNSISIGDSLSSDSKSGITMSNASFYNINSNSISMMSNNTASSAFIIDNSSSNNILNNVFANLSSKGYAISVAGLGSVLSMDNNLLFSNSDLGSYNTGKQQDLATWQSNTGFDSKSISENPLFRASNDLKICSKNADNIGLGFGLRTDFDNNLRDPNTPDPGAFEYSAISGITVADQRVCKGDTATFFVATSANDVVIWNHTDTTQFYKTNQTGTYSLTALGVCGADTTSFKVVNNDLVKLGNDTNICGGDTLNVMSSLSNASYSWNNGMSTQSIGVYKNGRYIVNVVDSDACVSADTIEVTVSQMVALRSDTSVCSGKTVELDPGTPGGSYTWKRDGIILSTGTKIFADLPGKYSVQYIDAKSCMSADTFELTVIQIPSAKFTWTQNQNNFEFTADDKTATNYFWAFGDGKSVTGPAWKILNKYATNGSYNVTLKVSSAKCGDSTLVTPVNVEHVGIDEYYNSKSVTLYPNPSNGLLHLDIPSNLTNESLTVEVLSADGKLVYSNNSLNTGSINDLDLRAKVSTGMYIFHVKTENDVIYSGKISIK